MEDAYSDAFTRLHSPLQRRGPLYSTGGSASIDFQAHCRKIVGWAMRDHLRTELASAALAMAIQQQRPADGLVHHSDRGVQYAAHDYRSLLQSAAIQASMSRKVDCYDNAPMESFFHTLKTELVHHRKYATRTEAKSDILAFLEGFYNRIRLHSALGYIRPVDMERKAA